jgi:4-hydroxy-tetrahydrodipicolinate synthase
MTRLRSMSAMVRDVDSALGGVLPAIVTPMAPDGGEVDEDSLTRLTHWLINAGVSGIVPCGSTGEFAALSHDERRRVTEVVAEAAARRVPVVPQTGSLSTAETVELSRHAESLGVAAVLIVPPFYEPPSWRELVAHFQAVRQAIGIPIVYYNLPAVTGIKLSPAQLAEFAELCGIRYVKDTTGDAVALTELVQRHSRRLTAFNGWDSITFLGFAAGTTGSIWGAANFIPELCVQLFQAVNDRADLVSAREIWGRIWPICEFLEKHTYAPAVKAGCELVGLAVGPPRPPFLPLSEDDRATLADLLDQAGVSPAVVQQG